MRVLLVYPEFPETYWSFRHALRFEGKKSVFPPLGLITVSSMLPKHWERRLVDLNVRKIKTSDIEWADVVFISAMLIQRESLLRVVKMARSLGKRIAVGGPYVTTTIDELDGVEYIMIGEAETVLPELIKDLEEGNPGRRYEAPQRPALTSTPVPDFGVIDLPRYSAMSIQYSRGCPFQCEFCDIIEIYGRVPRTKTNDQVLAELDALVNIGWRGTVFIVDDNFIGNKRNVKSLLPDLIKWQDDHNHPFTFITEASVNLADDNELLAGMQRAGFHRVFLGIETPAEESLKETKKYQNTKGDLLESVKKIQGYGMEVMAGFIVGFDSDPDDIFDRMTNFIRESAIPLAMVGLLNALPNTQLWRRLSGEGRLLYEGAGNNTDCSLNFITKMDPARVVEGYKSIVRTIYSPKEYYQRALECLKRVRNEGPRPHSRGLFNEIATLTRITFALGVFDRERKEFWRYMRRAIIHHRQVFDHAVMLAAQGYHLRRLTEAYCE